MPKLRHSREKSTQNNREEKVIYFEYHNLIPKILKQKIFFSALRAGSNRTVGWNSSPKPQVGGEYAVTFYTCIKR